MYFSLSDAEQLRYQVFFHTRNEAAAEFFLLENRIVAPHARLPAGTLQQQTVNGSN